MAASDDRCRPVTSTEFDQADVEKTLRPMLEDPVIKQLYTSSHFSFLFSNFGRLPDRFQSLDCSRPWLIYWMLHAADLLGKTDDLYDKYPKPAIARMLAHTWSYDEAPSVLYTEPELASFPSAPRIPGAEDDPAEGEDDDDDDSNYVDVPEEEEEAATAAVGPTMSNPNRRGCFSGGPGQCPHLASAYAAVSALVILGEPSYLDRVDRVAVENWLVSLRSADGAFRMHRGGEVDIRATFCAAAICQLLSLDRKRVLVPEAAEYVARCQTHEGGIAACASSGEAHGGYVQCGLSALLLIEGGTDCIDLDNLARWCAMRQQATDGGFCGRTNKLVDSCYSFWLGSACAMVRAAQAMQRLQRGGRDRLATSDIAVLRSAQLIDPAWATEALNQRISPGGSNGSSNNKGGFAGDYLYDQRALQFYVTQACQNSDKHRGGLQDKPGAGCDFYHTCYSMSGLSVAQNDIYDHGLGGEQEEGCAEAQKGAAEKATAAAIPTVVWPSGAAHRRASPSLLRQVNPLVNVCRDRVAAVLKHAGRCALL